MYVTLGSCHVFMSDPFLVLNFFIAFGCWLVQYKYDSKKVLKIIYLIN